MKKYILIGIIIFAFVLVVPVLAKNDDAGSQGIHESGTGLSIDA